TIREDLRLVMMSATLDTTRLAEHMAPCEMIHSEGRMFPVDVHYDSQAESRRDLRALPERIVRRVPVALRDTTGHVLVFLPGVGEIIRAREALADLAQREQLELLPLYGDLSPAEQDRVLSDGERRKLILSTNVAETSLTIPGVTAVIDSGLARQLNVHPATGLPRLDLVPISRASADQRAGRAGRTAAGRCWRLWDQASHSARAENETAEILRADLSGVVLQMLSLNERDLDDIPWLDRPPADAIDNALTLLRRLGAIDNDRRVTQIGHRLARLPAHPRLARLLLAGADLSVLREATLAAALLSERDPFRAGRWSGGQRDRMTTRVTASSQSDLVDRVTCMQLFHNSRITEHEGLTWEPAAARQVLRAAEQFYRLCESSRDERAEDPEQALRQALLAAYPDRLAKLRSGSRDRARMIGGRGVCLDESSRVRNEPLFLCLELSDGTGDARVRIASAIEAAWLDSSLCSERDELFFNPTRHQVEARRRTYCEDLLLEETPIAAPNDFRTSQLLAEHAASNLLRVLPADDSPAGRFRARVGWLATALPDLELPTLDDDWIRNHLDKLCVGSRSLDELRNAAWLDLFQGAVGYERLRDIERLAPGSITLPKGRQVPLQYELGKPPILAARIQEFFGLQETPRIADGRITVLLHLLGPNFRPQQVTSDLASFWQNTYPQVRKELRRRYPKHAWPEKPE
ncbi:MAG: hypothetical protein KDB23_26420, partial [Planctomycetales bacterium]|nr:hypothetical protein [Planctomycetales bacterium]